MSYDRSNHLNGAERLNSLNVLNFKLNGAKEQINRRDFKDDNSS
jgi:hypothetical protein